MSDFQNVSMHLRWWYSLGRATKWRISWSRSLCHAGARTTTALSLGGTGTTSRASIDIRIITIVLWHLLGNILRSHQHVRNKRLFV